MLLEQDMKITGDNPSAVDKLTAKNKEMRKEQAKNQLKSSIRFKLDFKKKLRNMKQTALNQSTDYGWEDILYESLTEAGVILGKTHEKRFKKHLKAKRAKEAAEKKARMKAAKKRARARQITLDSGDPEVAHMVDPVNNPRRW